MTNASRRRLRIAILALLLLLGLLLVRCSCRRQQVAGNLPAPSATPPSLVASPGAPAATNPPAREPDEVLTPATLEAPAQVAAGTLFAVKWSGPANDHDYLTIVPRTAKDGAYEAYRDTREGNPAQLTAPIEPGEWEVRYMTTRSRTVLGRTPVTVVAVGATLEAAAKTLLGDSLAVTWTGPNNAKDYITIVPQDTRDGDFGNYTYTAAGSPLTLLVPPITGAAELRYMTGLGAKVLARRAIEIVRPEITLEAATEAVAGSLLVVAWHGPNHPGDYVTVVPKATKDGEYANYANTSTGAPLNLLLPMATGEAELRYMTNPGAVVLARRPVRIVAAEVSLTAAATAAVGSVVTVTWQGPANSGDYITLVPQAARDSDYADYTYTKQGSPLTVAALKSAGPAELRYVSGQGAQVLARRPILIVPHN